MKVLMLGWEFPPFIAGGLGTACYGLTRAMNVLGVDVLFVLPRPVVAHAPTGPLPANDDSQNGTTNAASNSPTMSMVGADYAFPHAQQAGTPTVALPPVEHRGSVGDETLHSPMNATTRMSYMDYNLNEFEHVKFRTLDAMLSPYLTPEEYRLVLAQRQRMEEERRVQEAAKSGKKEPRGKKKKESSREVVPATPPAPIGDVREVSLPTAAQMAQGRAEALQAHGRILAQALPQSMLIPPKTSYSVDLMSETERYATLVAGIAHDESFDVIHAHDWMTFRAGVAARNASGMPLIVHVHSTEYDRNPHRPDPAVIAIETEGLEAADCVIAVSHMTRRLLVTRYGVDEEKIRVVHNAIDGEQLTANGTTEFPVRKDEKVVLFLGRITAQKGPEYFLAAARKVLDVYEPVKFIMAGAGDLMKPTIELAAAMGIGHKVLFTGFLNARDVERIYQMADLYVMPSVSEPFGIAPLEALSHNVPVIVSKQSGVAEILKHALKVDFWDIDALADRILAVLRHAPLASTLREHAREEVRKLSWVDAAKRVLGVYQEMVEQDAAEPAGV